MQSETPELKPCADDCRASYATHAATCVFDWERWLERAVAWHKWLSNGEAVNGEVPPEPQVSTTHIRMLLEERNRLADTGNVGVVGALAKLREKYPDEPVSIHFYDYSSIGGRVGNGYVTVTSEHQQNTAASLTEALAAALGDRGEENANANANTATSRTES